MPQADPRLTLNLTAATVAKLQPEDKPYEIRDTIVKGLLLRVQPTGRMTWYVTYINPTTGKRNRYKIGSAPEVKPITARDVAKEVLGDVAHKKDPNQEKKQARLKKGEHTLRTFLDGEYGDWAKGAQKRAKANIQGTKCSYKKFLDKNLKDINLKQIEKHRADRLQAGRSKATIDREVTILKAVLNKAVQWGVIETNPISGLKLYRPDNRVTRYLDTDEEARFYKALDKLDSLTFPKGGRCYPHLKPMVLLAMNTGLRRNELFTLTWDNVNIDNASPDNSHLTVKAAYSKSGKTRHVSLNAIVQRALKDWREQSNVVSFKGLVFPSKDDKPFDNVKRSWTALLKEAEITEFRWHDMRHHFASKLVMVGVDLNTVRELMGHSDLAMTLRYAHLAPEHKAAAVAKLVV